ncbi:MAG: MlaD family protein [Algoriphagus sp.]|uniref:MlaD family protein n=1 Tax=Algoriphagus sp. TaxID=1872435 RepID=UPI002606557D|nr:MlaD family protein [Algoriphagus sp.]MDG1277256.1 MlaD family protein [Algoriphagus sp.]
MKKEKKIANAKLGALVLASMIFLVFSLYLIGKNQNIFGSSIRVIAEMRNVNGLLPGNNIRFKGMDVGTVSAIEMLNDTTIQVELLIHKSMQPFIKNNSKTTINTDGIMGNKILHINPMDGDASPLASGDILYALPQIDTDEMLETLNSTGNYLEKTLINLTQITEKLNESEALWSLLSEPKLVDDLNVAVQKFKVAGANAAEITKSGKNIISSFEKGDGIVNSLFTDSIMNSNFEETLIQLQKTSAEASEMMETVNVLLNDIQNGQGTAGLVLQDSVFRQQVDQTLQNLESSTYKLNENMEAMKSNFLFRGYFRKQEKAKKKAEQSNN